MAQGPKLEEQHQALQMVSSKIPGFVQSVLPCWQQCFPNTFPFAKFFYYFSPCYQLLLIARLSLGEGGEGVWFRLQFCSGVFEIILLALGYKTCFGFSIRAPVFLILVHGLRCVFVCLLRCANTVQAWISYNRCGTLLRFLFVDTANICSGVGTLCVCMFVLKSLLLFRIILTNTCIGC